MQGEEKVTQGAALREDLALLPTACRWAGMLGRNCPMKQLLAMAAAAQPRYRCSAALPLLAGEGDQARGLQADAGNVAHR